MHEPSLPNLTLRTLLTLALLAALGVFAAGVASIAMEVEGAVAMGALLVVVFGGFLVAPVALDLLLLFFYTSSRKRLEELPPHLAAFIRRTCEEHRMTPPRLRVIHDSTPTAFTYGWSPSTARVVFSEGLLELLAPGEVEAVIGHELGHAKSWDILVASIASAVPTFINALGDRLADVLDERSEERDHEDGAPKGSRMVLWAVRVLAFLAELTTLSLSRVRELHADRFGAKACGSPAAMARALIKISYGLARRRPVRRLSAALQVQGPDSAQAMLLSSGAADFDHEATQYAMAWDLWNPWARVCELQSTHPTTARRLLALAALSQAEGEVPAVRFELQQRQRLWGGFFVDAMFSLAPAAALCGVAWSLELWGRTFEGWALIAVGLAIGAKAWFKYRGRDFPETTVAGLLKRLDASPIRGVPCTLRGHVIGRGDPGLVWCEDFTFRDDTGLIAVDHRQPLNLWEFLWGLFRGYPALSGDTVLEGWFRRGPVPYLEVKRFWVDGRLRRSYFRWLIYVIAASCIGAGLVLQFQLHAPVVTWLKTLL